MITAGCDQQQLPAISLQAGKLFHQARKYLLIQAAVVVTQDLAADFYNDTLSHWRDSAV